MVKTLFGSVRAKPQSTEFTLHVSVADVLRRWAVPGWRWTHLPFGEQRGPVTGARLKRMGTQRGWPDFILLSPALADIPGRTHFLELKRPKATLTDEQYELMTWLVANGYEYRVVYTFRDAVDVLKQWGAVRSMVST